MWGTGRGRRGFGVDGIETTLKSAVNPRDSERATPVQDEGSPAPSGNTGPAGHPKLCSLKAQPLKS